MVAGDVNGDGWSDLFVSTCLNVNDGAGTLLAMNCAVVPGGLSDAEIADLDGDGFGDIVGSSTGSVVFLRVAEDGMLEAPLR